jgi:hypothetical protein
MAGEFLDSEDLGAQLITLKPLLVPGSAGGKALTRHVQLTTPQVLHLSIVVQLSPLFQSEFRGITVADFTDTFFSTSSTARLLYKFYYKAPLR